jgi:hypothetical protein
MSELSDADMVIRTSPRFTSTVAVLASLCVAIAVGRLRFIRDLPDWDVATYALIGNELAHGKQLYADAWDMKPPAIFASFAAAEWITRGSHAWSAYVLSVVAACATTFAIYVAASSPLPVRGEEPGDGHDRARGLWAAALWTCVALHPALGTYLPNTEAAINACFATAIALSLRRRFILAGIAVAIATLFKHIAIAPAVALAIWMLATMHARPRNIAVMLAIIPLSWLLALGYFAITSRGGIFYATNFVYSRFYGGNVVMNILHGFEPRHLLPRAMLELVPLVLIGLAGLITTHRGFLIALFVGTFIAIAMPGQFFEHYCQLWLVPLALGGAFVATRHRALGAIACIGLLILQFHRWTLSARDRAAAMHPASFFLNVADTGREIHDLLREDETMFVWCDEVQLYWLANRRPITTGLWRKHMTEGPLADTLSERTLRQLQQHPPDLIVTMLEDVNATSHPIGQWIAANYSPVPGNQNRLPLALRVRNGSALAKRSGVALP